MKKPQSCADDAFNNSIAVLLLSWYLYFLICQTPCDAANFQFFVELLYSNIIVIVPLFLRNEYPRATLCCQFCRKFQFFVLVDASCTYRDKAFFLFLSIMMSSVIIYNFLAMYKGSSKYTFACSGSFD